MIPIKEIIESILDNGGSYEQEKWRTPGKTETVTADSEDVCKEMLHGDSGHFEALNLLQPEENYLLLEIVDSYGGEDQGSEYYHIWKFTRKDVNPDGDNWAWVRFDGTYASHYGTDYNGYRFVSPQEKVVIVYE